MRETSTDIFNAILSRQAHKILKKIPAHIAYQLGLWIENIAEHSLTEVRKMPGHHDEALRGKRKG
jgi:hypothetical protein